MTLAYDVTIGARLSSLEEMQLCVTDVYESVYGLGRDDPLLEKVISGIRQYEGVWLLDIWGHPYCSYIATSH